MGWRLYEARYNYLRTVVGIALLERWVQLRSVLWASMAQKKSPVLMIEIVKDGWLLYVYTCNAPKEKKKQIDS